MTGAITHAASAPPPSRRMAIDWRVIYRRFPLKSAVISGRVLDAGQPQKSDGALLMIQREILLAKAKHARNLRQIKAASGFEADLRRLTHSILKEGMRK